MKIEGFHLPESAFLSVEKDMEMITDRICANDRLQKYLFYTDTSPLNNPDLTDEQLRSLFKNNVKMVPKIYVDREVLNYLLVRFDTFSTTGNPEFRENIIEFDILCHYNQWHLKDYQLRPYRIAAEIDSMINGKHLTGMGELRLMFGGQINTNDEYAGVCLKYRTVHGQDDRKFFLDPDEDAQFVEDFNEMIRYKR